MRAKQSEIELFSANARQVAQLLATNPVNFLEARFWIVVAVGTTIADKIPSVCLREEQV